MCVTDNACLENRKSSSGRKIARMARIVTIFGPSELSRGDLFSEKVSNGRNERKYFKKISEFVEKYLNG